MSAAPSEPEQEASGALAPSSEPQPQPSEPQPSEPQPSEPQPSEPQPSEPAASAPPPEPSPPPPVAGSNQDPEPTVVALVFLLPPLALGGVALGLLLAGNFAWDPLGVALFVGLIASVAGFAVIRRLFQD
ncbi:MAG: hypothetical protein AB7N76_09005 [Planctomycetota bacterium]